MLTGDRVAPSVYLATPGGGRPIYATRASLDEHLARVGVKLAGVSEQPGARLVMELLAPVSVDHETLLAIVRAWRPGGVSASIAYLPARELRR